MRKPAALFGGVAIVISAATVVANFLFCFQSSAGDEQWDERFGNLASHSYGQLIFYRGEVYGNRYKWTGTNLVQWTSNASGVVRAASGTNLFAGGNAFSMFGLPSPGIARWDGALWYAVDGGVEVSDFGHFVGALCTNGTDLYVGGSFYTAGGVGSNSIARWDGSNWYPVGAGLREDYDPPEDADVAAVYDLAIQSNNLYVGGDIGKAGDATAHTVARWDGTNWFPLGNGFPYETIYSLGFRQTILHVAGEQFLGGPGRFAKWNGTNWINIADVNGIILTMAIDGTDVYIGGKFTSAGGISAMNIAKWDGTNWFPLGSGISGKNPIVRSILVSGDDVIVSGSFTNAGGKPSRDFAIWHNQPKLTVKFTNGIARLDWLATPGANYALERTDNFAVSNSWAAVSPPPVSNQHEAPISITNTFFRLRRP